MEIQTEILLLVANDNRNVNIQFVSQLTLSHQTVVEEDRGYTGQRIQHSILLTPSVKKKTSEPSQ